MNDRRLKAQRKKLRLNEQRWRSFKQRQAKELQLRKEIEHLDEQTFKQELKRYGIRKHEQDERISKDYVPSMGEPLKGKPNPDPRYHELVRRLYRSTSRLYGDDDEKN